MNVYHESHNRVIAYGAGTMAKLHLPKLKEFCIIDSIWDIGAVQGQNLYDIEVVKPDFEKMTVETEDIKEKTVIVFFIIDPKIRFDIEKSLNGIGYKNIYGFERVLSFLSKGITIESLISNYQIVGFEQPEVLFDIMPCNGLITADGDITKKVCDLELSLRNELNENSRTEYRPIKMYHRGFYDPFAIYEKLKEWYISKDYLPDEGTAIINQFLDLAANKEPIVGLYVDLLLDTKEYKNALQITEEAITKDPNSLFLSIVLEKIRNRCEQNGVDIDITFPSYNLSERFCFSGVNFATCEGLGDSGVALNPCFRGHQCAARPSGEFWKGKEWMEFRKSLFDGSFRYCQKDRCPNILGGWLPRKSDYTAEWLEIMSNGDFSEAPPLEELHLSYDNHCNLMCNSCRKEIRSIDNNKALFYNNQFDKYLRKILKQCKHLTLSGCGEASISPHGRWLLQSLSSNDYPELSVELRTNTFAFSDSVWEKLGNGREVIKHITASVDGATKETFEKLRYPSKWEVFTKNLRFIQSLRKNGEIEFFEFHVVAQTANIDELLSIVKMAIDYDADAVTFSRIVYWNNMTEDDYFELNPFYTNHPRHDDMMRELENVDLYRKECMTTLDRPFYVNIHGYPDPDESYKKIRIGKLKVR